MERGCWSGERNGSERAKVASVAEGKPARARGPGHLNSPDEAHRLEDKPVAGDTPVSLDEKTR
ncbi:MAG: hypothetical protein WBF16_00245, partial [Candidatus Deferrimicrobiaceae bacterium]